MHSYIITGIRFGPLIKLLRSHGFTASPRNMARLLFIMQNGMWASLHAWRERKKYGKIYDQFPVPEDPVFIIGHWRTGSTFLHLLLALDDRLIAPSLFQVTLPEGFLVGDRFYRPIMGAMVGRRPMDNMILQFDDPQEEEFALLKLTLESPLLKVIFPAKPGYFIDNPAEFLPPADKKAFWQEQFRLFCRKILQDSGKMILLKNPVHSLRIPLLLETFPKARFIHLHRHPCEVVASSLHLWKVMAGDNQLKGRPYFPSVKEVTAGLGLFHDVITRDLDILPAGSYCETAYRDLMQDPVSEIRRIYRVLGLECTPGFKERINGYLEKTRSFKKNTYNFGEEDKLLVYERLKKHFEHYQYQP